jgi:flagellar biosynthesis regulator FlaF
MVKKIFSSQEFNPRCLVEAAALMDRARKGNDKQLLAEAVDHNKKIWADIHFLVARSDNLFPKEVCSEMTRLSDYVWSATKSEGRDISDLVLNTLINIDLQISEGLLYGEKR